MESQVATLQLSKSVMFFNKISEKAEKFFCSNIFLILITLIAGGAFAFKLEVYAMAFFIIALGAIVGLSKDITPIFLPMVLVGVTPLARYGQSDYFYVLAYFIIFPIVGAVLRAIFMRKKLTLGKFFAPTVAVAFAVTIGGLFSISLKSYFAMPAIYYVFFLGIGMVFIYLFLENYIPKYKKSVVEYFAKMMLCLGIMCIIMILSGCIRFFSIEGNSMANYDGFQWGNNLSNNLLMAMPFAFYLSTKNKFSPLYFIIGVLEYIALLLSYSRGGIMFGTIMFPLIIIATFICARKKRIILGVTFVAILAIVLYLAFTNGQEFLNRIFGSVGVSKDEARVDLYKLAWQNFIENPIFGTGLGYIGGKYYLPQAFCIYWYHSTLFQIIGSMGVVGIICYGYQYIARLWSLGKVRTRFNLFAFLSFVGIEGYSLVNVGDFIPIPICVMIIMIFIIADRNNNIHVLETTSTSKLVKTKI